jgi:hypothetical protein
MEEMIRAVVQALRSSNIRYVVIGGIAASIWGRPRMTLDADIVITITPERLAEFLQVLVGSGFQVAARAERRLLEGLPVKVRYGKRLSVDLRIASYSLDQQALARAVPVRLFGVQLRVASREDTVVYKLARFDDMDRADIKAIVMRWRNKLDSQYIAKTCRQLVEETGDGRIAENLDMTLGWS